MTEEALKFEMRDGPGRRIENPRCRRTPVERNQRKAALPTAFPEKAFPCLSGQAGTER